MRGRAEACGTYLSLTRLPPIYIDRLGKLRRDLGHVPTLIEAPLLCQLNRSPLETKASSSSQLKARSDRLFTFPPGNTLPTPNLSNLALTPLLHPRIPPLVNIITDKSLTENDTYYTRRHRAFIPSQSRAACHTGYVPGYRPVECQKTQRGATAPRLFRYSAP